MLEPAPGPGRVRGLLQVHRRLRALLRVRARRVVARRRRADLLQHRARAAPPRARQLQAADRRGRAPAPRRARRRAVALPRRSTNDASPGAQARSASRLVTTVPSGDRERDAHHPLRRIVGGARRPDADRHERLLERSDATVAPREFERRQVPALRPLNGEAVLLIDDTWTTGPSAQSAAAALEAAGAGPVAAVVIGRHLNREWHENDRRLRGITRPFDWSRCAVCSDPMPPGELRGRDRN